MASPSKEENILKVILENSPLKHWRFKELLKETRISRRALNKWLNKYVKKGLLIHVNEKGKFPYFTCGKDNVIYQIRKKQFMLNKLYNCGLISELLKNEKIKIAIIFGSSIRGDWYKDSDIDVFIYGNLGKIEKNKCEKKLKKDIELHVFKDKKEIDNVKTGLIKNIINGYVVKGNINQIAKVA
ncbi:nucleotidyltransferase domain-containing protein [Candidatus Woesearchaeota archaeon]|nr:nucleotidyltransferase domain-containing protein [Candidatus Woesearchaeota archaeon]